MKQKRFVIRLNRGDGYYWCSRDGHGGWNVYSNVGVARRFTKAEADESLSRYYENFSDIPPGRHSFLEIDESGHLV